MQKVLDVAVVEKLAKNWEHLVSHARVLERKMLRESKKNLETVEPLSAVIVVDKENKMVGTKIAGGKNDVNEALKKEYEQFVSDCKKHLEKFQELPFSIFKLHGRHLVSIWVGTLKRIRECSFLSPVIVMVQLETEDIECCEVWSFFSDGEETVLYDGRLVDLSYSYNQVFMSAMGVELL